MKVFASQITKSRAIDRIEAALRRYAPKTCEFVDSKEAADLVILYVNGRRDHLKREVEYLTKLGKKYALVQLCLRSTLSPSTKDWISIWKDALLTWSYYDLPALCKEDEILPNFNFYRAPLGVDEAFQEFPIKKEYVIATSGMAYTTESVRECILAAISVKKRVFHLGPVVTKHPEVDFSGGMTDTELAKKYSACEFVSGLRRGEGFELPIIEGLVCGARPIVFDRPDSHHWFDGLAVFIPETDRNGIVESLVKVFGKGAPPVTKEEIEKVKRYFNWETIIRGFWERIFRTSLPGFGLKHKMIKL
jgi:glycosyltransferase involved in cell wall biosynthesis